MRAKQRAMFVVLTVAGCGPVAFKAHAADCPPDLATARKVRLIDDKGRYSLVEAANGHYTRRTEAYQLPQGPVKNISDAYQGVFVETVTTESLGDGPAYSRIQYNKLGNDDFERLKKFWPPKVGGSLVLDSESILLRDTASPAPSQFAQPNQRVHTVIKVQRDDVVTVGPCSYKTVVLETTTATTAGAGGPAGTVEATYHFAPQLKTWLRLHLVSKTAGQPDVVLDRSTMSVATEK